DHLLDRSLALRRAQGAAEVLAGDHVGGQGGPALGKLEVLLLEDYLAVLVGDGRLARVPLDSVVGVNAFSGESALDAESRPGLVLAQLQLVVAGLLLRGSGSAAPRPSRLRPARVPVRLVARVAVGVVPVAVRRGGIRGAGGRGACHSCSSSASGSCLPPGLLTIPTSPHACLPAPSFAVPPGHSSP